jgi:predicted O-methyltransferase YrrM
MALGARDLAHLALLAAPRPRLAAAIARAPRHLASLRPAYERYVRGVSTPEHAASLELASLLRALCEHRRPQRVVDLGSGFTSYVLRAWAAGEGVEAWSVDDDEEWLGRTRGFLLGEGLGTDNLLAWPDFLAREPPRFDLVLHDLGRMSTRVATLPRVLDLAAPAALVVLDDVDKDPYYPALRKELSARGWPRYNLRWRTLDGYGRFAALTVRPGRERIVRERTAG